MKNEVLESVLLDREAAALVDRYLASANEEGTAAVRYPLYAKRLAAKRFVLPIAGMQGSGKSTLLNAIVFEQPILPNDADETTSVPVEIGWASEPSQKACVVYLNGREETVPATTEESLSLFVDNKHNPGNKNKVERVKLESNHPLLKRGLVLVDLPGMGSLTNENSETTLQYLKESVGIIFLLRTVPPLTHSESIFVSLQWTRFPAAFFVQNRWNDETDEEADEGKMHNETVLSDIARRNHIPIKEKPVIHIVNVYRALDGVLTANSDARNSSGLPDFLDKLDHATRNWTQLLEKGIFAVVQNEMSSVKDVVNLQLKQLEMDSSKLENEMKNEKQRFDRYITDIQGKQRSLKEEADGFVGRQMKWLSEWRKRCNSELRNKMREKLKKGIVDGKRLDKALREEQEVAIDDVIAEIQEKIMSFQDNVKKYVEESTQWEDFDGVNHYQEVNKPESTKLENIAPTAGGVLGVIGGGIAGAKIGAALGWVGGPLGSFVAGTIGATIGSLLGWWAGRKTQQEVLDYRIKNIEPAVFEAIDRFTEGTRDKLKEQIESYRDKLISAFVDWEKEQASQFEVERKRILEILEAKGEEKESLRLKLRQDLKRVDHFLANLKRGAE